MEHAQMNTPSGNESLVEIVARALAKCVDGHERNWADYEPEARAAIAAMVTKP
jgi:hypothetical protein